MINNIKLGPIFLDTTLICSSVDTVSIHCYHAENLLRIVSAVFMNHRILTAGCSRLKRVQLFTQRRTGHIGCAAAYGADYVILGCGTDILVVMTVQIQIHLQFITHLGDIGIVRWIVEIYNICTHMRCHNPPGFVRFLINSLSPRGLLGKESCSVSFNICPYLTGVRICVDKDKACIANNTPTGSLQRTVFQFIWQARSRAILFVEQITGIFMVARQQNI